MNVYAFCTLGIPKPFGALADWSELKGRRAVYDIEARPVMVLLN